MSASRERWAPEAGADEFEHLVRVFLEAGNEADRTHDVLQVGWRTQVNKLEHLVHRLALLSRRARAGDQRCVVSADERRGDRLIVAMQ